MDPAEGEEEEEEAAAATTEARRGRGDEIDGDGDDAIKVGRWKARCGAVALFAITRGKTTVARRCTARVGEESIIAKKGVCEGKIRDFSS